MIGDIALSEFGEVVASGYGESVPPALEKQLLARLAS